MVQLGLLRLALLIMPNLQGLNSFSQVKVKLDDTQTIGELKRLVREFRDERNWSKLDTARSLAISIALEAAELLEHYKWENEPETNDNVADELADVIICCLGFSEALQIDISQALTRKLQKNTLKYPVT